MSDWTKQKLEQMIADGVEENLTLDYKRADSLVRTEEKKKAELVRDVCAFANSSGGVLIYGIAEPIDKTKRHLPERLDPVNRLEISKEWIEQIIQSIQPRIEGVVIHPVVIDEQQNQVCYVVEVPKSHTAHQARDHIYYKRHNFNNLPMEDYEVRDVMNRKTHPLVSVIAQFVVYSRRNNDDMNGALVFDITNESDVFARYVKIVINAPPKVRDHYVHYPNSIYDNNNEGSSYLLNYSNHLGSPLFPRVTIRHLFPFKFVAVNPNPEILLNDFRYEIFADSMPKKSGIFTLDEIYLKVT
jgi:hypothetical protein